MAAKTRNYTEVEWDALDEKLENPTETVICPRCGNEIAYEERGNSMYVHCMTAGCIFGGVRGL
jgi:UDP-N-acetylmuramyl tripeptide synthase